MTGATFYTSHATPALTRTESELRKARAELATARDAMRRIALEVDLDPGADLTAIILLCCSCEWSPDVTDGAADDAGHRSEHVKAAARDGWGDAFSDLCATARSERVYHYEASTEAAYRLIESSPTLRREWFGRP